MRQKKKSRITPKKRKMAQDLKTDLVFMKVSGKRMLLVKDSCENTDSYYKAYLVESVTNKYVVCYPFYRAEDAVGYLSFYGESYKDNIKRELMWLPLNRLTNCNMVAV